MSFNSLGYTLIFIQCKRCKDNSKHLFTNIYKFYSPKTKLHYILHADYHEGDVFAIKFYCKKDKKSNNKYSKIVNKGDVSNLLITCANVVPLLLKDYPKASFVFSGARSIDTQNSSIENYENTQRFRIYRYLTALKFGTETFAHFEYRNISAYLLFNKKSGDMRQRERQIVEILCETYENLYNVL